MKVLITGSNGQLGHHLMDSSPEGWQIEGFPRTDLDISDREAVMAVIDRVSPDILINAAAYTAVDKAEKDRETAHAVNVTGVANLAEAISLNGGRMIHVSTDFVFDGKKSSPYAPGDMTNPVNVYGASKLEGEHQALELLKDKVSIIRTAWVYSSFGNNFVLTMLRLMRERDKLGVVCDQIGTPTWAWSLAEAVWSVARKSEVGLFHWTDAGVASWYDFAVAIYEEGVAAGILEREVAIRPIKTEEYPTPARRPPYSVLDVSKSRETLDCPTRHWRESLRLMLKELEK